MGRFGLAVIERMGEDWMWLSTSSGHDASLKNLRLLHVRPDDDGSSEAWRKKERPLVALTRYVGEDDLPSLALNMVILRSLGLIRYHNGTYQVALPHDAGVVEKDDKHRALRRRRYFEWRNLSPDPIVAMERLRSQAQRSSELDMFLTPIVERVCHGHSPRILLRCIGRCRALLEGRDPSPWDWISERWPSSNGDETATTVRLPFERDWLTEDDKKGLLEGVAPEPMVGWKAWCQQLPKNREMPWEGMSALDIHAPAPFAPTKVDLRSPLDPAQLLRVDWETTGWAADELSSERTIEFHPVEASMFRLGFFDHDNSSRIHQGQEPRLPDRLRALGREMHRGLIRLWIDLQRNRIEDVDLAQDERQRDGTDDALHQSLNILGELLVRPLVENQADDVFPSLPEARADVWVDGPRLPHEASSFLRDLIVEQEPAGRTTERAVAARLTSLGLPFGTQALGARTLFREVKLSPAQLDAASSDRAPGAPGQASGIVGFRAAINDEVRHLFNFSLLSQYRQTPTRRPPRLTVYVVAEMSEPFCRTTLRTFLRELHAELLRAYGPIFGASREGFDRSLSIVPLIWMPNPADAFGADFSAENRAEEAAIIESIQGVRRWVESLPREVRCISQVFINSRVTESSVLSVRDAVRQTRDFVTFGARNDVALDPWLRQTAVGPAGDDVFATFSCFEIDFPAERAREYLANRFARDGIARLRQTNRTKAAEVSAEPFAPPPINELVENADRRLRQQTKGAADRLAARIEDRIVISAERTSRALQDAFNSGFEDELFREVHDSWMALTRRRGNMDDMIDELRRNTSGHLGKTLVRVRTCSDGLIEEHASQGGLKSAQMGFNLLQAMTRDQLQEAELAKQQSEELCVRHRIPDTSPIAGARNAVVEAAIDKPDDLPMRIGIATWLLMVPALGAPMSFAIARALNLNLKPNVFEFILGPLGPLVGGALLFLPVLWLLRRHMRLAVERVQESVRSLADAARRVVEGSDSSIFAASPSIRSFFAARLRLTAALAARNYSTRVHEQVVQDNGLAYRLSRSVEIQQSQLGRRAEDLGVRPHVTTDADQRIKDDTRQLFGTRAGDSIERLIDAEFLDDYYRRQIGSERELDAELPRFIREVGGFARWRKEACLADTEVVLAYGRAKFQDIVNKPVCDQLTFDEEVGGRLASFVSRHYANVGFGARFGGLEGLDPNGMRVLADASLVLHPALHRVFDKARRLPGAPPTTETLHVIEAPILPNSAYILSLVQGVRAESIRNLRRFESFYDRTSLPDESALSAPGAAGGSKNTAITHLTGHEGLRASINAVVHELASQNGTPPGESHE
ncbi:MAG: hypothetical protein H0U74_20215 [Bradymonadaceae bacterium]|nr:hypothetical protein [Lujinxingiaceae bacterium]